MCLGLSAINCVYYHIPNYVGTVYMLKLGCYYAKSFVLNFCVWRNSINYNVGVMFCVVIMY